MGRGAEYKKYKQLEFHVVHVKALREEMEDKIDTCAQRQDEKNAAAAAVAEAAADEEDEKAAKRRQRRQRAE